MNPLPRYQEIEFSLDQILEVASRVCAEIHRGEGVGLVGALGGGKTTFVRACVSVLKSYDEVSSPTYVLQHLYRAPKRLETPRAPEIIEHWDVYRVGSIPEELTELVPENAVRFIEWADKFPELLLTLDHCIHVEALPGGELTGDKRTLLWHKRLN